MTDCSNHPPNSGEERFRLRSWLIAAAAILASAAMLLAPLPNSYRAQWTTALLDLGHLPLFALIMYVLWRAFDRRLGRAFLTSVFLAALFEVAQLPTGRTADVPDFLRGFLGASITVVVVRLMSGPIRWNRIVAYGVLLCGVIAWPLSIAVPILMDAWRQYETFPVLCDFRHAGDVNRWYTQDAEVHRVRKAPVSDDWVGRIDCSPPRWGTGAVTLFPVVRDWSRYSELCCEFSFAGEPTLVQVSVRDGRKVKPPQRRMDFERRFKPGRHRLTFDLQSLARGDDFAPLDLTRIQSFHFMATALEMPRSIDLHHVFLR